jgi:hypothetical protein
MNRPRIFADFHNADAWGRLRLNCVGTVEDLARRKISLRAGQSLVLYSEDLEVDGVVQYSQKENLWVAVIDWEAIREVTPHEVGHESYSVQEEVPGLLALSSRRDEMGHGVDSSTKVATP